MGLARVHAFMPQEAHLRVLTKLDGMVHLSAKLPIPVACTFTSCAWGHGGSRQPRHAASIHHHAHAASIHHLPYGPTHSRSERGACTRCPLLGSVLRGQILHGATAPSADVRMAVWHNTRHRQLNVHSAPHLLMRVSRVSPPRVEVMNAFIPSRNEPSPCWFVETATLAGPS